MVEDHFITVEEIIKEKEEKIRELNDRLIQTERKLNELNKNLENKVIERTVEVNKLLKHKIRFIDSLSHDLGTPLTPLVALLPAVKDQIKDQEIKETLETCIRNVEYIKRVVATYFVSLIVVGVILTIIEKCPWKTDYVLAIKRIFIVAFPASMSATIADVLK